jgi:acyl-CoA reductase-like NAD-dependent aldehyde dehydrogenase
VASAAQRRSVESYITTGTREGRVIAGGPGPVPGLDEGHFVRPTVFSGVSPAAVISREEIFGPVLTVIPVSGVDEAVEVANNFEYGVSGGVWAGDNDRALTIARRLRTGQVAINGGRFNTLAPLRGFGRQGTGRRGLGREGLAEYTEFTAFQLPA